MLVTRPDRFPAACRFRTAEVVTWTHRLNDRNAAFICRYAGPAGPARPAFGNVACRAADGVGVLRRLVHRTLPRRKPEAIRTAHAAGAPAPHQHLPSGGAWPLHVRDGQRQ